MRKDVEDFLREHETDKNAAKKQARDSHLLELGLFRMEYWDEFCKAQGDGADVSQMESKFLVFENGRRCRKIPLEVTDEEYAAICEVNPEEPVREWKEWPVWPVQKILFVLAIGVYVSSFCIGIAAGYMNSYGFGENVPFQFAAAMSAWLGGAVSGSLLLAAGEHLRLMEKLTEEK